MKIKLWPIFLFLIATLFSACTDSSDPGDMTATADSYALFSESKVGAGAGTEMIPGGQANPNSGIMTAGEWNDLDNWEFWLGLSSNENYSKYRATWGFFPDKRYAITVRDQNDQPVMDAKIILRTISSVIWVARTDNFGRAELWEGIFNNSVPPTSLRIEYKDQSFSFASPKEYLEGSNTFTLPISSSSPSAVDIMFVVDATGSMGDEIDYLKNELYDVLVRVKNNTGNLRTGSVFYRDKGDEYLTRAHMFTTHIDATVNFVKDQSAAGGGDYPEAVHSALEAAIEKQDWSAEAKARLLFLILDAPPHETIAVKEKMRLLIRSASLKGIKIIPITASGIDKNTEFLMRYCAMATNGTYVFITDHSGIGNPHLEPTIGKYEVEFLNDLMLRLIHKYSE